MSAKLSGETFKSNESEQLHVNYKLTLIFMSKRERGKGRVATKVFETDHSSNEVCPNLLKCQQGEGGGDKTKRGREGHCGCLGGPLRWKN